MITNKTQRHSWSNDDDDAVKMDECFLRSSWTMCAKSRKELKRVTVFMRSAERVDRVFGSRWIFTEKFQNKVYANDLNVPRDADSHPMNYLYNPPITNIGKYVTQLTYRALFNRGVDVTTIYCSPTLRSLQTAICISKTNNAKICIEPGLLEPVEWYQTAGAKKLPQFELFYNLSTNIDLTYKPIFTMSEVREMFGKKSQEHCLSRIALVVRNICGIQRDRPTIVIAHAITMDICYRIGKHGDEINNNSSNNEECTSYEDYPQKCDQNSMSQKLELGVRYPPGSVLALHRVNDSPPYVLRQVHNVIPPLTSGLFSNAV